MRDAHGSTPLHSDDQLDDLGQFFLDSDLPFLGITFIQFARAPANYGHWRDLQPFRLIFDNGETAPCSYLREK
jgi:hypothetical protein